MSYKIPLLTATLMTLGTVGLTMTQPTQANASSFSNATKGGPNYTTYYTELTKSGYAYRTKRGKIDFSSSPSPYFTPLWSKSTKAKMIRGTKGTNTYGGGPQFSANKNSGYFYKLSSNPAIRYTNVGKFDGKQTDMIIQMKGYSGQKLKETIGGAGTSYAKQTVVFMTNKFGVATPKKYVGGAKARVGKSYKNAPGMNAHASHADFTIRIVKHGTNTNVKADADHTIGLGFMEIEPAYMKSGGKRHYSLGQRVMTYDTPVQVGNYTTKAGKSNIDREFGSYGVLKLKDDSSFPSTYFTKKGTGRDYTDFGGPQVKNSALAVYKTSSIGISWRGHAPYTDLLDINGMKLPKSPQPQPSPKKYVGPQSAKPSTYSATKSALVDYTKTFSWKIQQKTKKASYSGKGYTITDKLPAGTTIDSVTAPKGWSKSVSGNNVTFKATTNVYKAAKTYNFYVVSKTTKAQALKRTSFNNHVTSKRKVSSSKWQSKNSNTAKWTLKNQSIKGYFIDFDHHDHAVAKAATCRK
ncbi:hypothetical protein D8911_13580 [Levilactobacillus brevis]|nr:hypothetical protein D8911_13580 [Levilactobacillus brevis]